MIVYRGTSASYVQAWECSGAWSGYVYTQQVALDKWGEGCDIKAVTIVRHDDGSREYLPGCLAGDVLAHREGIRHECL